jgi:hypothetical protein
MNMSLLTLNIYVLILYKATIYLTHTTFKIVMVLNVLLTVHHNILVKPT